MNPKTQAKTLCILARAFVELERLRRDMRGLPNPRPVAVDALTRVKRIKAWIEPADSAPQKALTTETALSALAVGDRTTLTPGQPTAEANGDHATPNPEPDPEPTAPTPPGQD